MMTLQEISELLVDARFQLSLLDEDNDIEDVKNTLNEAIDELNHNIKEQDEKLSQTDSEHNPLDDSTLAPTETEVKE